MRVWKSKVMLLLLLLLGSKDCLAQQDWTWTFGDSILMRFPGGGAPVVDANARTKYFFEMGACISDHNGNLKLYVDRDSAYRSNGSAIPNYMPYFDVQPINAESTNGLLILPVANDTTKYLVFFLGGPCNTWCLWYAEPFLAGGGADSTLFCHGAGHYDPQEYLTEKLTAVRAADGGWWVFCHGEDQTFVRYKVSEEKVIWMATQDIGSNYVYIGNNPWWPLGEMCFSPEGDKLLAVNMAGAVDVFDFDRCTGLLSNWDSLGTPAPVAPGPNQYYGCSFSPDGTKVYASDDIWFGQSHLWQWDLTAPDIRASKTLIFTTPDSVDIGQHQLGPDGKIYITTRWIYMEPDTVPTYYLSVINDPNQAGIACNFTYQSLWLDGRTTTYNLPNLPNYNLPPLVAQYANCGPAQVICAGDSVVLGEADTTGGTVTYLWTGPGVVNPNLSQQHLQPTTTAWYYLTVTDSLVGIPCGVTQDSVLVTVVPINLWPMANAGMDTIICAGDSVLLGTVGDTNFVYSWNGNADSAQIWATGAGMYVLTVRNPLAEISCLIVTDTVNVDVYPTVLMPLGPAGNDTVICQGDSAWLGIPAIPGWDYWWSPGSFINSANVAQPLSRPPSSQVYELWAVDSASAGMCAQVRDTVVVKVEEPFAHTIPESQHFCPGEILTVGVASMNWFSYAWSPVTGLQNPYLSATTVAPLTPITYTLAVTSDTMQSENCKTQYFPVVLTSEGCMMQNVVTPNGDGLNDFLNLGTFNGPISLAIYDRWGAQVYATNGYNNDWPQQDTKLPESVYYYVVKVTNESGKQQVGEVMVLR